jgi:hypothetical protein
VYRDASMALDESDRAVGAILIGEALVDRCDLAWALARDEQAATPAERWRAIADIHDTFPEIWRHLDRARKLLATRGANTTGYDELRPYVRRSATNPGVDGSKAFDAAALEDVKRAIGELKIGVPGADWAAIEARTQGLVRVRLARKHRPRVIFAGAIAAFAFAVVTWVAAIVPHHKPNPRVVLANELDLVTAQRKLKIEMLRLQLGDQCAPPAMHELMRQLVLDGRKGNATALAIAYMVHCGEDLLVETWATAPRAHPAE